MPALLPAKTRWGQRVPAQGDWGNPIARFVFRIEPWRHRVRAGGDLSSRGSSSVGRLSSMTTLPLRASYFARVAIMAVGVCLAIGGHGQTVTADTTGRPATSGDGTVTLSPFEVNTDRDVGYVASNSL